jgi:hypothetical protein
MHIAQAYGVRGVSAVSARQAIDKQIPHTARQLVAGNVSKPVSFDAAPMQRSVAVDQAPVFQMYTRSADRIEAATAIHIGRAIDVTG